MPFLLAEILNFQGSIHRIGVGSFSYLFFKKLPRTTASFPYFFRISSSALSSFWSFLFCAVSKRLSCKASALAYTEQADGLSVPGFVK